MLKDTGTLWLNLGDSYAHSLRQSGEKHAGKLARASKGQIKQGFKPLPQGMKEKDMVGIPWRVAFALQADGWYLRSDIIWSKPNPMPESVTDRPTKAHEYVFLMSKKTKYYYDADAIKEKSCRLDTSPSSNGRIGNSGFSGAGGKGFANKRTVWTIPTQPYSEAHFATFPEALVEPCLLAGCPERGVVYDPFMGAGTVAKVALRANRQFIGSEINPDYVKIAEKRIEPLLKQISLFP